MTGEENIVNSGTLAVPLRWLISLRWWAILVGGLVCWLAHEVFVPSLPIRELVLLGVLAAITNLACSWLPVTRRKSVIAVRATMVFDVCALSVFLMLYGGPANPFSVLYLVHIALAAMILSTGWVWSITALCWLGYTLSFWVHRVIPDLEGHHTSTSYSLHLHGMLVAFVIASALIALFVSRLSIALQERDRTVRYLRARSAHQEKLAALTTLAAGAAHELSTPLGTIAIVVEELRRMITVGPPHPAWGRDLDLIDSEVKRCSGIIRGMAGEPIGLSPEPSVSFLWSDIISDLKKTFEHKRAFLQFVPAEHEAPLKLFGGRKSLIQALSSLVKNSIDAQKEDSFPKVMIRCDRERQSPFVSFVVTDRGSGMSTEQLKHVGEPFFTTKEVGQGLGLGIFLVQLFAERNGGSITFISEEGSGCQATLRLPYLMIHNEYTKSV